MGRPQRKSCRPPTRRSIAPRRRAATAWRPPRRESRPPSRSTPPAPEAFGGPAEEREGVSTLPLKPSDHRELSAHVPISPPSSFVMATSEGRGGMPSAKSGQRVDGLSNVESPPSAGCWTETKKVLLSGVKQGPHISAPIGTRKNILVSARPSPVTSAAQIPSPILNLLCSPP